ncbi:helix-turn-helix domain-containing protein [Paramuribaculum intestinale]|uniref:helix-turn-helix domain-containing protein n=1 Tax=Paramuribaculum intestinale TaxID=2094151 RepID=UPI0034E4754A
MGGVSCKNEIMIGRLRRRCALYCHKNTLAYKLDKIRRILGYDILKNENRVKIMVAIYIRRLGTGYF